MSIQESLRIVPRGSVALLEFDLIGEKVNKLSTPIMHRLREVVGELNASDFKAVVLISRKKSIFIAGADIEEIRKMTTEREYLDAVSQAHAVFNLLEDLKMPTVAAIHGACLGGGCELVLCCDYRLASADPATRIGLPETKLGIIPGFGGCVRLPRVIGLQAALGIILEGKAVDAKKAQKLGLVDEVLDPQDLESQALRFAEKIVKDGKRRKRYKPRSFVEGLLERWPGRAVVFSQARKSVQKLTKGFYPAPFAAIRAIEKTYGSSQREQSLAIEAHEFVKVAVTDVSKNLISLFYMMEDIKKQSGVEGREVKAKPVGKLAVLGAGTMGGGIAYVAADKGVEVRMKDLNNDALARGFKAARDIWKKKVDRKQLDPYEFEQRMGRVSGSLDFSQLDLQDVVVEAIVEDMNVKKKVIAETATKMRADAILATNTSSLSVNEMASAFPRPEHFVGMHFFNPVDKMPLVEVIRGEKTSDETVATIFELSKKLGKTPVVVRDGPGFLVNRLLLPWLAEALFFLEDGMDVPQVDRVFTHQFGMPMGPFRLMDEIGLDVAIKVLKIFKKSLGDRIEVSGLAEKLSATDRLGCKNKKGFYLYHKNPRDGEFDPSVYSDLGLGPRQGTVSERELLDRSFFQMINEAARALYEDRIVDRPEQVDLGMIMGTGFPPFRGGLLRYADQVGIAAICQQLEEFAPRLGVRFKPCAAIQNMAKNGRKFYSH
jgi:3-hydroxyacyl-CoA dehydrogenase/enoyl-CoA hydratase/3-hydroxybutyryl-CoA epimerase